MLILVVSFFIFFGSLLVFLALNDSKKQQLVKQITSYSLKETNRPRAQISATESDLGSMRVQDERIANFVIANIGKEKLQLYNVRSSCDCTFAQVVIDDVVSPEFSMHAKTDWLGTIDPSKSATIRVIYRPAIMPVKGNITRQVFIDTNDPEKKNLTFTIKAKVD